MAYSAFLLVRAAARRRCWPAGSPTWSNSGVFRPPAFDKVPEQGELRVADVLHLVGHDEPIRVLSETKCAWFGRKESEWQCQHRRVVDGAALQESAS